MPPRHSSVHETKDETREKALNTPLAVSDEAEVVSLIRRYFAADASEVQKLNEAPKDLESTDDIGECEAFTRLVDIITGRAKLEQTDVSLPYAQFKKFDQRKTRHSFKILAIRKDMLHVQEAIKRAQPALALLDLFPPMNGSEGTMIRSLLERGDVPYSHDRAVLGKDILNFLLAAITTAYQKSDDKERDKWMVNAIDRLKAVSKKGTIGCSASAPAEFSASSRVGFRSSADPMSLNTWCNAGVTYVAYACGLSLYPNAVPKSANDLTLYLSRLSQEGIVTAYNMADPIAVQSIKAATVAGKLVIAAGKDVSGDITRRVGHVAIVLGVTSNDSGLKVFETGALFGERNWDPTHSRLYTVFVWNLGGNVRSKRDAAIADVKANKLSYAMSYFVSLRADRKRKGTLIDAYQVAYGEKDGKQSRVTLFYNSITGELSDEPGSREMLSIKATNPLELYCLHTNQSTSGVPQIYLFNDAGIFSFESSSKGDLQELRDLLGLPANIAKGGSLANREASAAPTTAESIYSNITRTGKRIYARMLSGFYNYFSNDLGPSVESLSINHIPGTSVSIPLEGEPAPVVQSTGGRKVQVVVHFKSLSAVELAKLSVLFKVTGVDEALLSMLKLGRSNFQTGGGKERIRYVMQAANIDELTRVLKATTGTTMQLTLDEPLRVENELLSSMGLFTFIPTDLSVETDPELSGTGHGVFDVTLTMQYINLSNRGESLTAKKQGANVRVLPMANRLDISKETSGKGIKGGFLDEQLILNNQFGKVSFLSGLIEVAVIYMLSKFCDLYNAYGGKPATFLEELDEATTVDQYTQSLAKWNNFIGSNYPAAAGMIGTDVVMGLSNRAAAIATKKGYSPGKTKGILGAIIVFLTSLPAVISLACVNTKKKVHVEGRDYNCINLAAMLPFALFDMARDFAHWTAEGTVDAKIKDMAAKALYLLDRSIEVPVAESGNVTAITFPMGLTLPREVTGGEPHLIERFSLYFSPGVITEEARIFGYTVAGSYRNTVDSISSEISKGISGNPISIEGLIQLSALGITQTAADAILACGSVFQGGGFKDPLGRNGNARDTATRIVSQDSATSHAREILTTLCCVSGFDALASLMIIGASGSAQLPPVSSVLRGISSAASNFGGILNDEAFIQAQLDHNGVLMNMLARAEASLSGTFSLTDTEEVPQLQSVLSGMFVDDEFTNAELRVLYGSALEHVVEVARGYALLEGGQGGPYKMPLTPYDVAKAVNGDGAIIDMMKVQGIQLLNSLLSISISAAIYHGLTWVVTRLLPRGLAKSITWVFDIISIGLFLVGSAISVVTGLLQKQLPMYVTSIPFLFVYSAWMAGRLRDGIDGAVLLEMCFHTGIWQPNILKVSSDANDKEQSSYLDYPMVKRNGRHLMPDHFYYKMPSVLSAFRNVKGAMDSFLDYQSLETPDLDYTTLMKELKERVDAVNQSTRETCQSQVLSAVQAFVYDSARRGDNSRQVASRLNQVFSAVNEALDTVAGSSGICVLVGIGGSVKLGYVSTSIPSLSKKALVNVEVKVSGTEVTCKVTPDADTIGDLLASTDQKDKEISNTILNKSAIVTGMFQSLQNNTAIGAGSVYCEQIYTACSDYILAMINYQNTSGLVTSLIPDTLGYLMLLKQIVGSSIRSVGAPGMAIVRNTMASLTKEMLLRSGAMQANYIYPTVKLYFIDEDSETWYLFDDLYSYSSILDVMVHSDETSPQDVAVIRVSNVYGNLTNVMADRMNKEMNFVLAPSEDTPIHGLMLRVGCRIKIQAGSTPYLTEKNTIFTGEISSLEPGEIVTIEAIGHGSVLLEDLTPNRVKTYPPTGDGDLGNKLVQYAQRIDVASLAMDYLLNMGGRNTAETSDLAYMPIISSVADAAGYVLTDITASSSKLDDYSILPSYQEEMTGAVTVTALSMADNMKKRFGGRIRSDLLSLTGAELNVRFNRQLMENVHLTGDADGAGAIYDLLSVPDMGSWVSYNETGWDVLQEMNLLLPNHRLLVRPYDTRMTLVWGIDDDYYRYRRATDVNSALSVMVINRINSISNCGRTKPITLMSELGSMIDAGGQGRISALAFLTMVVSIAQRIDTAVSGNSSKQPTAQQQELDERARITLEEGDYPIRKALSWLGIAPSESRGGIGSQIRLFANTMDIVLSSIQDAKKSVGIDPDEMTSTTLSRIRTVPLPTYVRGRRALIVALCIDEWLKHGLKLAYTRSTSHKPVSNIHAKMSGRDVVKNDIALQMPYNALRMSFPPADLTDPEKIVSSTGNKDIDIPVHYKLKPWVQRTYASYFKNANVMKKARGSVISMAAGSILCNLMGQAYGGSLTLLSDPEIFPGDKVFLWDENRDMWGPFAVRARTFLFSPTEGALTVVTPRMITRNEHSIAVNMTDVGLNLAELAVSIYFTYQGLKALKHAGRNVFDALRVREIIKGERGAYTKLQELSQKRRIVRWMMGGELGVGSWMRKKLRMQAKVVAPDIGDVLNHTSVYGPTQEKARKVIEAAIDGDERVRSGTNAGSLKKAIRTSIGAKGEQLNAAYEPVTDKAKQAIDEVSVEFDAQTVSRILGEEFKIPLQKVSKDSTKLDSLRGETGESASAIAESMETQFFTRVANRLINEKRLNVNRNNAGVDLSGGDVELIVSALRRVYGKAKDRPGIYEKSVAAEREMGDLLKRLEDMKDDSGKKMFTDDQLALIKETTRSASQDVYGTGSRIFDHVWNLGKVILSYWARRFTVYSMLSATRSLQELVLISQRTANNVTVAPMFFRGEPFIAGLEGMDKGDGAEIGYWDATIRARFANLGESLFHGVVDPIRTYKFELMASIAREKRLAQPYKEE